MKVWAFLTPALLYGVLGCGSAYRQLFKGCAVQEINKDLLKKSSAGMRLIAQTKFYNSADFSRLKVFVEESYHPALFEEQSLNSRIALMKARYRMSGRQKVFQVIAIDKYEVAVLMQQEKVSDLAVVILSVEEDYPHRVVRFDVSEQS